MTGDGQTRGQAFTLEGVIGAIIVLSSVVLALQAVDIAPLATGGDDAQADRLETEVSDLLATAADRDALRTTVTCATPTGEPDPGLANPNDPLTGFGVLLNQTLAQNNEFVVLAEYRDGDSLVRNRLYPAGEISPPSGAVSASRQVTLYNSDPVRRTSGDRCVGGPDRQTLAEDDQFYIDRHPDFDGVSNVYNAVRVKIIAW
ncbi:DUF7288 family protein [Haloarcula salinisoli]|uniref:Uncharacterized protein n=1 Tax=Haloarcula salinisoli TaxID=2487746 RepID=A0A8J7YHX7_9EURY|nr:hypothetical protein [Halomicroarcula salinisoli]MBX0284861.1 hypothetical protein [Halomicroarcula salinisoli]MBX0303661.1 hypothetical protein [Halomicroarcula salinisoli]